MVERPMAQKPYYLVNFERLCAHALRNHAGAQAGDEAGLPTAPAGPRAGLLTTEEGRALAAFVALPLPAQLLFVRMLTRKGPWLRSDRLDYPEVGPDVSHVRAAADALVAAGLVVRNEPVPAAALLALLRDEETRPLATALGLPARTGVAARHAALAALIPASWLAAWVGQRFDWLRVHPRGWIDTLLLLFFGNRRQDLSTFVVADLGHVRYEPVAEDALRVFEDGADFGGFRSLLDARDAAGRAAAHGDAPAMLVAALELVQAPDHRLLPGRRDRALVRLAEAFGRAGHVGLAIALCDHARGPEAAHRRALLEARPLPAGTPGPTTPRAKRAAPYRPEQRQVALDWRAGQVERCTLDWLRAQGYRGAHYENHFATALFGLACWDIVFAPVPGAFFNPWQVGPADLHDEAFLARRSEAFEARLADIRAGTWRTRIARCAREKQGIANPFIDWRALDWPLFEDLCDGLANDTVAAMCARIAQDPRRACSGFPDLSLRRGDAGTEFCEVKSPNDQLSTRQREWLQLLQGCGHPAWVARIATAAAP